MLTRSDALRILQHGGAIHSDSLGRINFPYLLPATLPGDITGVELPAGPAIDLVAVTPGATPLPFLCRGLQVTVSGVVVVYTLCGSTPITLTVVAGDRLPVAVSHVLAGTTATVLGLL